MRSALARVAVALAVLCFSAFAPAQTTTYPLRSVRLIVPYPPGGSTDFVGREVAHQLGTAWGQQVVVDNRPGAGSQIGIALGSRANADGYTITFGTSATLAVNPGIGVKMPFEPHRDFVPIGMMVYVPYVLVATASLPVHNIRELIEYAKTRPGKLNFASPGVGTPNHLGVEMLNNMAGLKLVHVPYKGGAAAVTDLVAGDMHLFFSGYPQVSAFVKTGRLRIIGVATPERTRVAPDFDPIAQTLPGFDCNTWFGLLAPRGTPAAIINRINADLNRALADPAVIQRLLAQGVEPRPGTPRQFWDLVLAETDRWRKVAKFAGLTPDMVR
jgi:tripartite-type tricarboxylate transporter receptor subunit TctC